MAHHLSTNLFGQAEMAYTGQVPWHGLGTPVEADASIDTWRQKAGLMFDYVQATPMVPGKDEPIIFKDYGGIYRSDNLKPMAILSKAYKLVQPVQMLEFFRSLVESEGFTIETVGALKEGRRIWAMAKTNFESDILGSDRYKANLLLITSCDGSLATTAKFVSTRVVCWNTQDIALHSACENGQAVKVRHSSIFNPDSVKSQMGLLGGVAFDALVDRMRRLTKVTVSDADAQRFLTSLLPKPTGEKPIEESAGFKTIMNLFGGAAKGSDLPGVDHTAYGLLNAVTEYVDHKARAHTKENRFLSAMYGPGATLKAATEDFLMDLAT